jgi:large subunit ribosomal protein L21
MKAVIEAGGKQVTVAKGDTLYTELVHANEGETVTFDNVLMVTGAKVSIGDPYVKGASVTAKVLKNGKQKKILVFKYKPKKNYKRMQGHRQPYSKLEILDIKQ